MMNNYCSQKTETPFNDAKEHPHTILTRNILSLKRKIKKKNHKKQFEEKEDLRINEFTKNTTIKELTVFFLLS